MLRAVGFQDEDFKKSVVGIASTWSMVTPCNMHINRLAEEAQKGVQSSGCKPIIFNTITVSDGISMGTSGMRYSLVSREVIADSVETVAGAQGFDGLITIGGCDKNMPGCVMAMARLNRPSIFIYGGSIRPGAGRTDIVSVFEAVGKYSQKAIDDKELYEVEKTAIPGAGSCGGMYTANSMATAIEVLGLSLTNSSSQEAESIEKTSDCQRAGVAIKQLIEKDIKPSDILTREAFENAIVVTIACGGSTNVVLHLLAIAYSVGVKLELDDFTRIGKNMLADVKPSGKYLVLVWIFIWKLSTRPEKSIGSDEQWKITTQGLKQALEKGEYKFAINEGDGAFYGPKIDMHIKDALGRTWQCGTIQLDMALPERFDLSYINQAGDKSRPIMIHRTIMGSIERFTGVLIEHFSGRFPFWMSPSQIKILTVADRHLEFTKKTADRLTQKNWSVEIDDNTESIGKKVRQAQLEQFNYILVIGDKEIESESFNIRTRENKQISDLSLNVFIQKLKEEEKNRSLTSLF